MRKAKAVLTASSRIDGWADIGAGVVKRAAFQVEENPARAGRFWRPAVPYSAGQYVALTVTANLPLDCWDTET